jgi:putative glycosyltransferase (TIGR04348 family)
MAQPRVLIITPATAEQNNGNWRTAQRWARLLAPHYRVQVQQAWAGEPADAMLALHARRSAEAVAAWAAARPRRPLAVVLTGTDLYRDIPAGNADALASLALAQRLVVLHEQAVGDLPPAQRHKAVVSLQSMPARAPGRKPQRWLSAVAVGHLRDEKDPRTLYEAMRRLAGRADIRLTHIGAALDPALGAEAQALAAAQPGYRWLGALPHEAARRHIQRAHVLVHPSVMEGGAQAVIEAVTCGTPVLGSRMPGNLGLLGTDYGGWFAVGDAARLAALLTQCRDDATMLPHLAAQCAARAPRFTPQREAATLCGLIHHLLENAPSP